MLVPTGSQRWLESLDGRDQAELLMFLLATRPSGESASEFLDHVRRYFPGTDLWFAEIVKRSNERLIESSGVQAGEL